MFIAKKKWRRKDFIMTKQTTYGIIAGETIKTTFGFNRENEDFFKFHNLMLKCIGKLDGEFVTCANVGLELTSAECVIEKGQKLVCVMPYEEQATKWCECERNRFFEVHERSEKVEMLSKKYYEGCEIDAEKYIARNCDKLIFISPQNGEVPQEILNELDSGKTLIVVNCDDYTIKIEL